MLRTRLPWTEGPPTPFTGSVYSFPMVVERLYQYVYDSYDIREPAGCAQGWGVVGQSRQKGSVMEIYIHTTGKEIALVEVAEDKTVETLIAEHIGGGGEAWLEDGEEPLGRDKGLAAAGVGERAHVHVSKCAEVHVTVRYGGNGIERRLTLIVGEGAD